MLECLPACIGEWLLYVCACMHVRMYDLYVPTLVGMYAMYVRACLRTILILLHFVDGDVDSNLEKENLRFG